VVLLRDLGEFGFIDRVRELASGDPRLIVGIGDDAAAFDLGGGRVLLASVDAVLEGSHFRRETAAPADIGYKAVAAAVSDIAAMGGRPTMVLVIFGASADYEAEAAEAIIKGAQEATAAAGAVLAGGDVVTSRLGLLVAVAVLGEVARENLRLRAGAQRGDRLLVTGTLGDSAAGLRLLQAPEVRVAADVRSYLLRRHFRPTPRLAAGEVLGQEAGVHAVIDISDGLGQDLGHLCRLAESPATRVPLKGTGARIFADALPVSDYCRRAAPALGQPAHLLALAGGEDYELLAAVAPQVAGEVCKAVVSRGGVRCTLIGVLSVGTGITVLDEAGYPLDTEAAGWEHFRS